MVIGTGQDLEDHLNIQSNVAIKWYLIQAYGCCSCCQNDRDEVIILIIQASATFELNNTECLFSLICVHLVYIFGIMLREH